MPRRYHAYPDEFQLLNVMSTAGASVLGVGGPEWRTSSPPPEHNFHTPPAAPSVAYEFPARA